MKRLIVNADDFGLTSGVNAGIILAYKKGIVTSATIMMNGYATEEAFVFVKENPELSVGIHLVLTCGRPLQEGLSSLTDENGDFLKLSNITNSVLDPMEVEIEFRAQLDKFMSYGIIPSHIDSHHHVHMLEDVLPTVTKLATELDIPVRATYSKNNTATFSDKFYGKEVSFDLIKDAIELKSASEVVEVMCHPAIADECLKSISSYTSERELELEILMAEELKAYLEENDIKLISYRDL